MKKESFHICCNIDDNYAPHCGVMLMSLFDKNPGSHFIIHILISKLSSSNKILLRNLVESNGSICRFHNIISERLKGVKLTCNRFLTESTYYRLLIASTLELSVSKVLYLDSDIVIMRELTSLFELDISEYALAATKDIVKMYDEYRWTLSFSQMEPYFNAGVMLINLDYWRKHDAEKKLVEIATGNRNFKNHDQDVLNMVFKGKWFMLSPKWNRVYPYSFEKSFFESKNDRTELEKSPVLVHFVYKFKPWNNLHWLGYKWCKYKGAYNKYLKKSPWSNFKPVNLTTETKFGLYRYLFKFGIQQTFINLIQFISFLAKKSERLIFLPLNLFFKVEHIAGKDRNL